MERQQTVILTNMIPFNLVWTCGYQESDGFVMNKGKKSRFGKVVSILLSICLMVQPLQVCATESVVTESTETDNTATNNTATEDTVTEGSVIENTASDSTVIEDGQGQEQTETDIQQTVESQPETEDEEDHTSTKTEEMIGDSSDASYDLSECADTLSSYLDAEYVYTGEEIAFEIPSIAFDEQTTLYAGQDYEVSFESNTNAGTAKLIIEGIGSNTGSREYEFTIQPFDIKDLVFTRNTDEESGKQDITASYQGKELVEGVDFEANEPSSDPDVFLPIVEGKTKKAYIYIKGIGNFTGENMVSYDLDTYSEGNTARISGVSLSLNGNIGVNFYIDLSEVNDLTDVYVMINDQKYPVNEVPEEEISDGIYHFIYSVAAKQIHDSIEVRVFDKDQRKMDLWNSAKDKSYEDAAFIYSVNDYLDDVCGYAEMSDALKTLAESMRVYGSYAQEYFQYHAEGISLTVPEIGDTLTRFQKKKEGLLPYGITYAGSSLLLDSQTTIRHYFKVSDAVKLDDVTFAIGNTTLTPQKKGNDYYIEVKDIPASGLGTSYTLRVSDGSSTWNLYYSALSYVYDVINNDSDAKLSTLCRALYWYYIAAKDYFGALEDLKGDVTEEEVPAYDGDLKEKAGELIKLNAAEVNFEDWHAFNLGVLKSVKEGDFLSFEEEGSVLRIYNTDGTTGGVYLYKGQVNEKGLRSGEGEWYNAYIGYVEDGSTIYNYEKTTCDWKNDLPDGSFCYDIVNKYVDSDGKTHMDTAEYSGDITKGAFNGSVTWILENVTDCGLDTEKTKYHTFNVLKFQEGFILGADNEQGNVVVNCKKHSGESFEISKADFYAINGVRKSAKLDFLTISGNTVPGRTVTGNSVAGMEASELLNMAYKLAIADDMDYEKWKLFAAASESSGISYDHPVYGQVDADHYVGVYGGYGSKQFYIYYGGMTEDGVRSGSGVWISASIYEKEESDQGKTAYIHSWEKTSCVWRQGRPEGFFGTSVTTDIQTSSRKTVIQRNYSGEMAGGAYHGEIQWIASNTTDYVSGDHVVNSHEYKADFIYGYVQGEDRDSEGYVYIPSVNGGYTEDKLYGNRAYGLSGLPYEHLVSGNYVSGNSFDAEGSEKTVSGNKVSENTVTGKVVSGNSISSNRIYDMVSGNDVAKNYGDILMELARKLVTSDDISFDDWEYMEAIARENKVTYGTPLKVMTEDGRYIGIYGAYEGSGYYIYYGEMSNWKRSGNGIWMTANQFQRSDGAGRLAKVTFVDRYEGTWKKDRPNGNFTETNEIVIHRPAYDATVIRSYTGRVSDGAFDGNIRWTVVGNYTYPSGDAYSSWHEYGCEFQNGYVTGYGADREGHAYVPSIYGGYSEDKLYAYRQYGYGGLWYEQSISGDSVLPKAVSENTISGNTVSDNHVWSGSVSDNRPDYAVSGNTVSSNVGVPSVSANSISKYGTDALVKRAYQLVTAVRVDPALWNDFKTEARKGGICRNSPLLAEYEDGNYIGIYGSVNEEDIYIYYGSMNNWKRQGKGIWMTAGTSCSGDTDCLILDRTVAVWKNDRPNGRFEETHEVHFTDDRKEIDLIRTYSGVAKDGAYDGEILWNVSGDYKYRNHSGIYDSYTTNKNYKADFYLGYVQSGAKDSDGYVYIDECNGGYSTDRLYSLHQYGIIGVAYPEVVSGNTVLVTVSENNISGNTVSGNGVSGNSVSSNTVSSNFVPAVSANDIFLTANTVSDNTVISGNNGNDSKYRTSDDVLLSVAYELATQDEVDIEKWSDFTSVALDKGVQYNPLISYRDDGNYIGIYKGYDENAVYIYYGRMYNWKRSGKGKWISVSSCNYQKKNGENGVAAVIYKADCNWKSDMPDGNFTETVESRFETDTKEVKMVKTYEGVTSNGAYDGTINWTSESRYIQSGDISNTCYSYGAVFHLGIITGNRKDAEGYVYIPSQSGCCEERVSTSKQYGIRGIRYQHTVSDNSVSENTLDRNPYEDKGEFPVILSKPKDVYADYMEEVQLSIEAAGDDTHYEWYVKSPKEDAFTFYSNEKEPVIQADEEYRFYCHVTNAYGGGSDTDVCRIHINQKLSGITEQPQSRYCEDLNSKVTFTVKYTGYAKQYGWEISYDQGFSWSNLEDRIGNADISAAVSKEESEYSCTLSTLDEAVVRAKLVDTDDRVIYSEIVNLNKLFDNAVASGDISDTSADHVKWALCNDREGNAVLGIIGTGAMSDFSSSQTKPWKAHLSKVGGSIDKIIVEDGVTRIGNNAFRTTTSVTNLELGDSVQEIGTYAFYNCTGLAGDLVLPEQLRVIGAYAFYGCSGIDGTLYLPANLTTIEKHAFRECIGISGDIRMPRSLQSIGDYAFLGDTSIRTVYMYGTNLTAIGSDAFSKSMGGNRLDIVMHVPYRNSYVVNWAKSCGFSQAGGDLILYYGW